MNLKSTATKGFKFRTINSLVESWRVRLTWLDYNVCTVQDNSTCESKVVCAVYCKRRELCFFPSCFTIYDPLEQFGRQLYDEVSEDKHRPLYSVECFHMTSRRPCWCPKPVPWELNSFRMQTLSFVPINLHRCWPREWKHYILPTVKNPSHRLRRKVFQQPLLNREHFKNCFVIRLWFNYNLAIWFYFNCTI